jgi:hypothetical protein
LQSQQKGEKMHNQHQPWQSHVPQPQHTIAWQTKDGIIGAMVDWTSNKIRFRHTRMGTDLEPGRGIAYTIPRFSGANNDAQVFEITGQKGNTVWAVYWSIKKDMGDAQIWMDIPEGGGHRGGRLDNEITDNNFRAGPAPPAAAQVANQQFYGWELEGWESPRGRETSAGMFFVLPDNNYSFAVFNPFGANWIGNVELNWVIVPMKVRVLRPHKNPTDARHLLACLRNERKCMKWAPSKDTALRLPPSFQTRGIDWGKEVHNDGTVHGGSRRLTSLASTGGMA